MQVTARGPVAVKGLADPMEVYGLIGASAQRIHAAAARGLTMDTGFQPLFLLYLGEAYALANRLEDVLAFAGRALTLAREGGQRRLEARVLRLLGEATARSDSPEQAKSHYLDALAFAEELEMRPLVAHCHLGLGRLYRRTGQRPEAQEQLTTAATMYREMGMTYWLEEAEGETGAR